MLAYTWKVRLSFHFIQQLFLFCFIFSWLCLPPSWAQTPASTKSTKEQTQQVANKSPRQLIRVLCIDGGGTRGIISARILQAFEEKSGKPIHQLFDIIVGTSTGGILALALTMPNPEKPQKAMYQAKEMVQFYMNEGPKIFQRSIWRTLYTGFGLWGGRYDRKNLDDALLAVFKDSRLSQALCPVGVLSYSVEKHRPRFWTSYIAKQEARKDHYIRDAAGATSAAPTYFDPKVVITTPLKERLTEVDGGIYANNPALAAIIALCYLYPNFQREDLVVVSVGTGRGVNNPRHQQGLKRILHLFDEMIDANEDLVDETISALFSHFYDFQAILPEDLTPMDKAEQRHLQQLIKLTEEQVIDERKKDIEDLVSKLVATSAKVK